LLWLPVGFATTGAIQPYRALGFVERQPIDVVLAWAPMRSTPSRRAGIAPPGHSIVALRTFRVTNLDR